jgi:hypothetical protein
MESCDLLQTMETWLCEVADNWLSWWKMCLVPCIHSLPVCFNLMHHLKSSFVFIDSKYLWFPRIWILSCLFMFNSLYTLWEREKYKWTVKIVAVPEMIQIYLITHNTSIKTHLIFGLITFLVLLFSFIHGIVLPFCFLTKRIVLPF